MISRATPASGPPEAVAAGKARAIQIWMATFSVSGSPSITSTGTLCLGLTRKYSGVMCCDLRKLSGRTSNAAPASVKRHIRHQRAGVRGVVEDRSHAKSPAQSARPRQSRLVWPGPDCAVQRFAATIAQTGRDAAAAWRCVSPAMEENDDDTAHRAADRGARQPSWRRPLCAARMPPGSSRVGFWDHWVPGANGRWKSCAMNGPTRRRSTSRSTSSPRTATRIC